MPSKEDLSNQLRSIHGKGYSAYRDIRRTYDFSSFLLTFDWIQPDPFAPPSRLSIQVDLSKTNVHQTWLSSAVRRIATADFLIRRFRAALRRAPRTSGGSRGTASSGLIEIDGSGQEVLQRTAIQFHPESMELRLRAGLPAAGRRIQGDRAEEMLLGTIPELVQTLTVLPETVQSQLERHIQVVEDQDALRGQLEERGLVAFIANGSILPRRSGIDERPMEAGPDTKVVPFRSPETFQVTLEAPNQGRIEGMGIPEGVTLIVGGGFHGKSTVLRALERGVYNHVPGDGRDKVVTLDSAVKIRSEDGRSVKSVDISLFIDNLPFGTSTKDFSTENASGSTSQAANIVEAMEAATRLILIDEDTSATNFMIRDSRMQALIPRGKEPITPFLDRVRQLYENHQVSTVLVTGGSGDYFDVADRVIKMQDYEAYDVTAEVHHIIQETPSNRSSDRSENWALEGRQVSDPGFSLRRRGRPLRIRTRGTRQLQLGDVSLDLWGLEQLADSSQTRAIGLAILKYFEDCTRRPEEDFRGGLDRLCEELAAGLDVLSKERPGDLAMPRRQEIAAAINRIRQLQVTPKTSQG